MKRYEYIRIELDLGDLGQLNRFSRDGWRVVGVLDENTFTRWFHYALLERELGAQP